MKNDKMFLINICLLWGSAIANLLQMLLVYKIKVPTEFNEFVKLLVTDTKFDILMLFVGIIAIMITLLVITIISWFFSTFIILLSKEKASKGYLKTAIYLFFLINTLSVIMLLFSENKYLLGILNPFSILASISMVVYLKRRISRRLAFLSGVLSYVVMIFIPGMLKIIEK
jgi:hypothetical protein